jgi:ATP-binding cassette subfamily B protein
MSENKTRKSGIARLLEIAGKRKGLLVVSGLLAVIHAVLALAPYVLVFYIIDQLLQTGAGEVSNQLLL